MLETLGFGVSSTYLVENGQVPPSKNAVVNNIDRKVFLGCRWQFKKDEYFLIGHEKEVSQNG